MNILITGSKGQLARHFAALLSGSRHRVHAPEESDLDITNPDSIATTLRALRPDVVLNCAAYNLVDRAEQEYETAYNVNGLAVQHLATACRKSGSFLVHYGTDYVFDGKKEDFYTEEDEPRPLNRYGESKLAGEVFLKRETDRHLLLRVSWVFGPGPQNFLHKLTQIARDSAVLRMVSDQLSVPTYTGDIARFTMRALSRGLRGTFHLTNSGYATRYEFARYFLSRMGLDRLLLPVPTAYFPSPAERPLFSAMSNRKLSEALGARIPSWQTGVDRYVRTVASGLKG